MRSVTRDGIFAAAIGVGATVALAFSLQPAPAGAAGGIAPWYGGGGIEPLTPKKQHRDGTRPENREAKLVRSLCRGYLDREPTGEESRDWQRLLREKRGATEIVRTLMESDEFFVRQTYLGILRRGPDPVGMETHLRALRRGASRSEVIEAIIDSEELERLIR